MDLQLKNKLFLVGGATAGFGNAVARALIHEGANVIAVARGEEKLAAFTEEYPCNVEAICGDITDSEIIRIIVDLIGIRKLDGALINAGGPPATSFLETTMEDWDASYFQLLRWKVEITKAILPRFREQKYGRILFVESISIKQPIENLVLSNSLRAAVAGFVKTLSQEVGKEGITLNLLAPGYHETEAVKRVINKKSEMTGLAYDVVAKNLLAQVPVGRMGQPDEFATLAVWLLSPLSGYITGQTISVDGGRVAGIFG